MTLTFTPERIERWPLDRLKPYARNAKIHGEDQVAKLAASMARFGWTVPVLVADDGELIAGHGRVLAAAQLGLTEAPVIRLGHLSEDERRAYRIADNKLTEMGAWDDALLSEELQLLDAEGWDDLSMLGFAEAELEDLLRVAEDDGEDGGGEERDPDEAPAPPEHPVTRPGDLWLLGEHRLLCGDATDAAAVERVMAGERAQLLFTSPPYAQQRDYGAAKETVGDWDRLMRGVFALAPMAPAGQILVNLGLVHRKNEWVPYWDGWLDWMRAQGWRRFGWYVWDQGPGLPGDWNGRLAPAHEFVWHFNREARRPNKTVPSVHAGERLGGGGLRAADGTVAPKTGTGDEIQSHRIPDSVLRVMRHKGGLGEAGSHPAVFPVRLVEAVVEAWTDPGELLYEPFCGSGSQILGAERLGRRCFAVELDPAYCDVAVRRWQLATGEAAVLEGSGAGFEAVRAERVGSISTAA